MEDAWRSGVLDWAVFCKQATRPELPEEHMEGEGARVSTVANCNCKLQANKHSDNQSDSSVRCEEVQAIKYTSQQLLANTKVYEVRFEPVLITYE